MTAHHYVASLVNSTSCGAGREVCLIPMAKATHSYQGYLDFGVSTVAFFVAFVKAFKVEVFFTAVEIEKVLPFGINLQLWKSGCRRMIFYSEQCNAI